MFSFFVVLSQKISFHCYTQIFVFWCITFQIIRMSEHEQPTKQPEELPTSESIQENSAAQADKHEDQPKEITARQFVCRAFSSGLTAVIEDLYNNHIATDKKPVVAKLQECMSIVLQEGQPSKDAYVVDPLDDKKVADEFYIWTLDVLLGLIYSYKKAGAEIALSIWREPRLYATRQVDPAEKETFYAERAIMVIMEYLIQSKKQVITDADEEKLKIMLKQNVEEEKIYADIVKKLIDIMVPEHMSSPNGIICISWCMYKSQIWNDRELFNKCLKFFIYNHEVSADEEIKLQIWLPRKKEEKKDDEVSSSTTSASSNEELVTEKTSST